MVSSVPSIGNPFPTLDFETSVFKKEKVTLSGHDEVSCFSLIFCLDFILFDVY